MCSPVAHHFLEGDLLHLELREYTVTRCETHTCDKGEGESGVGPCEEHHQKRNQADVPSRRHAAEGRGLVSTQPGIHASPAPLKLLDCSDRMLAQSPKASPVLGRIACCKGQVAVQHWGLLGWQT